METVVLAQTARCGTCGWAGKEPELARITFQHDLGSTEQVYRRFFMEVRGLVASSFGVTFGQLLVKWGFLSELTPAGLGRYLTAIAKGIVTAIVQERRAIEAERISDG